ncbi:hypothetical protein [Rothia aerolata]|uniref:Integral membrane protein n=1 Tax=Rothia aerolata TaxID=1812262 RepID=A0A917IRW0_9MICC|nr:hypothetical protein [Rothia aerolata]GGH59866.1 hypothetical protein GCM10007359_07470 [Rothia aerolata]
MKAAFPRLSPTDFLWAWLTRARLAFAALPIWAKILLIFATSRLLAFLLFRLVGSQQLVSPWGPGPTGYLDFISFWDSGWYQQIAQGGYPAVLPVNQSGTVQENPWAFYPLFPLTAQFLATLLGADYYPVAAGLALVSGFCAAFAIFFLFEASLKDVAGVGKAERESLALWGLAAVAFLPVSPVLQVPYAESYNLFFLALTLLLMMRRHWWLAAAAGLFACLSRPVGVPLGAAAGIFWCSTLLSTARSPEAASSSWLGRLGVALKQTRQQLAAALVICAEALLWPAIAWVYTGRPDAYTATETAWRGSHLAPVVPWIKQGQEYLGALAIPALLLLVAAFVLVLMSRAVRGALHPLLIIWCAAYAAYLLVFLNPQSSLFRLLLPLFPLCLPLVALSASRAYRFLLLASGAVLQFGWIGWLWHWKELPGGGDYPP